MRWLASPPPSGPPPAQPELSVTVQIGTMRLIAAGGRDAVLALYGSFMGQIKEHVAELTRAQEAMASAKRGEVSH